MRQGEPTSIRPFVCPVALPAWRFGSVALGIVGCCLLVALGAQVRIPVPGTHVPATLQSVAVLLTGFALRPTPAAGAMLLYLAGGFLGLPFFAVGTAGTAGYLAGFVVGAWLVSLLRGRDEAGVLRLLLAGAVGTAAIFAAGVLWPIIMASVMGFGEGGVEWALATGLFPFVTLAAVKLALAVAVVVSFRGLGLKSLRRLG